MKLRREYKHEYVCCLPHKLENSILAEVAKTVNTLHLTTEEKADAIENANLSKVCDLTETISIEFI